MPGLVAVFFVLAADIPKTPQFFFGAGVGWAHAGSQDFPSCCGTGSGPDGLALSLEAQIEYWRFFAAASLVFAQSLTTEPGMVTGPLGGLSAECHLQSLPRRRSRLSAGDIAGWGRSTQRH